MIKKEEITYRANRLLGLLLLWGLLCCTLDLSAQITIGGNVYGGGNEGNVKGSTTVTVRACEVHGSVFGGARMADVGGRAFVNIDGEHTDGEIVIKTVYGGNDIAGTVGTSVNPNSLRTDSIPAALTEVQCKGADTETSKKNEINNSWCAFVRTSKMSTENETHRIIIGSVFGGGNGEYDYFSPGDVTGKDGENNDITATQYEVRDKASGSLIATSATAFTKPTLAKTYLELLGGCLAHIYGGGNNATVTDNTTICLNDPSLGLQHLLPSQNTGESDSDYEARLMAEFMNLARFVDLSTFQGNYSSLDYTAARVFGGNNKAEMKIHPVWNLQRAKIRDLYSGGNEGNMTNPEGIFLEVKPLPRNNEDLVITNVYGGCRRADVQPKDDSGNPLSTVLPLSVPGYTFPAGLSARTAIQGGHITNVYGGNDISGRVFGGNALGIHTTIYGDVYGGGNGSYAYTDNATLGALPAYADYYYNPADVRLKEREYNNPSFEYSSSDADVQSVEALNIFRPNAEQVSVRLVGDPGKRTFIKGSVFVGGNCATLKTKSGAKAVGSDPLAELKIGSYVTCDKVFLGNNGANMVTPDILHLYAKYLNTTDGSTVDTGTAANDFSQMDLTKSAVFSKYMEGCAMSNKPSVIFDATAGQEYVEYSTQFGSFYCGGNVGSMIWPGTNTINFDKKIVIYDKFVGGCNRANVEAGTYNAKYLGGMIGDGSSMENPDDGSIQDCMIFNFSGLKIQPKRWIDDNDPSLGLEWNTFDDRTKLDVNAPAISGDTPSTEDDIHRRLRGGNIYGGCYESGHMNGNVVINLLEDIIDKDRVFDVVEKQSNILYQNTSYTIKTRNSGVILDEQGMDPLGLALNVFGGGYGKDSEVWGSATVNLQDGYTFQIFGGGQQGPIGKSREDSGETPLASDYIFNGKHYAYDARYSTYVNLDDLHKIAATDENDVPETEFIYGGSFEAPIAGNTRINLGCGRIFNSFAGSCNADILGHTETYVGQGLYKDGTPCVGFPYVIDHIYGGNDLGGKILGEIRAEEYPSATDAVQAKTDCDFTTRVGTANGQDLTKVYRGTSSGTNPDVLTASSYIEYTKGRIVNIFGGAYGDYDYTSEKYRAYCNADGSNKPGFSKPRLGNAFINFKPESSNNALNTVSEIYGAGQGQHAVIDRDVMQERSYILVDIPQNMTQFQNTVFFGAGAYGGVGMEKTSAQALANPDKVSAVIDLVRGQVKNVYGGSYKEGVTRRTVVNVPTGSTITANNIFGGAYGIDNHYPCDVYESNVNYSTETDISGGIYGGNNNARRTLYANVNINGYLWSNSSAGYQGTVYGAGLGADTWANYTNVNIGNGATVYKAFGGGNAGLVLNYASEAQKATDEGLDITIGSDYVNCDLEDATHLPLSALATDISNGVTKDYYHRVERYNTNVHILPGGTVTGYGYGGGYGETATVSGTTYIDVLGGTVERDIYGGGQGGSVRDLYSLKTFIARANTYVKSGTVRNAYGGGYLGAVGYHDGTITASTTSDVLARSNVVVGTTFGTGFADGIPAITRNVYGSGEGGSIYGSSHLTINNGYIGYRYNSSGTDNASTTTFDERYKEELDDPGLGDQAATNAIARAGNAFGGGYIANSYVDTTYVCMYNGHLRGSLFGGGEVGPVGRGTKKNQSGNEMPMPTISMGGATHVYLYGGQVHRDVFGGGRGYDSWGGDGTKFMSDAQMAASDFYTKGFVFGQTDVNVRGGIVGTEAGVAEGYGNVFGGGDIGYVYSSTGSKVGSNPDVLSSQNGLPTDGGGYYYIGGVIANGMSHDCKVDVAPYCKVTDAGGIDFDEFVYNANGYIVQEEDADQATFYHNKKSGGTRHFAQGEYVPVDYLNLLRNKTADASAWGKLDISGIHIYNAIFAGGNVSVGSDQIFVNSNTVYGNATASLRDIFHRDLITIGTEHIGGLYGDGNLTFVDGFRELNITNYGTDFYGLSDNITIEEYHSLSDRERAYFELKYECQQACTDKNGKAYSAHATLPAEDYKELFEGTDYYNTTYWVEAGFCSIYAGRLLNTIQRADMVGVWGSRMVLQGARDRVPEKADYTNYTINRVGEVSLNRVKSQNIHDTSEEDKLHGNYFGIYSVVNYLGNLTSDVKFTDVRTTDVESGSTNAANGTDSYLKWKEDHKDKNNRNNGTSLNKVALASGVYLEITREESEKAGQTVWGYITGVIQLDLINVAQGLGGGYVYAKNEHGALEWHSNWDKVTLSPYNRYARTYKRYTYATPTSTDYIETSGNFVHNTKQIVDDCYPTNNSFLTDGAPAHYWYIKGSIYIYDQYISAYTGSATAYSQSISIPLTITAASHGKLTLRDVQPNWYAYYNNDGNKIGTAGANDALIANNITYHLNDPITDWDYQLLSASEKSKFVRETYTVIEKCKIGNNVYEKGDVMLPTDYSTLVNLPAQVYNAELNTYETQNDKPASFLLRPTNNVSHYTGYVLTYDINNPAAWNKYYTPEGGPFDLAYRVQSKTNDYLAGPTYRLKTNTSAVYGQRDYIVGDLITKSVYDTYMGIDATYRNALTDQATFEAAYVATQEITVVGDDNSEHHIYPGTPIAHSDFDTNWSQIASKVALANIVTSTLVLDEAKNEYLYAGDLLTDAELQARIQEVFPSWTNEQVNNFISTHSEYIAKAYYCTAAGSYGGRLYEVGTAYRAVDAWCGMSETDRSNFVFNYDALDLLIDPLYGGTEENKTQYDGVGAASPAIANDPRVYSRTTPIDYSAIYIGTSDLTYTAADNSTVTITPNQTLTREQYEAVPNERYHYTTITVTEPGTYYVVRTPFIRGDMPYTAGSLISAEVYAVLNANQKDKVDQLYFPSSKTSTPTQENGQTVYAPVTYYYCRDSYTVNEHGEGVAVTTEGINSTSTLGTPVTYSSGQTVPLGTVISEASFTSLVNKTITGSGENAKLVFNVVGNTPIETSTLYVSRESDIFDLSKEKIITVIYHYEYEESDESGMHIQPISEQHIVNIHLQFKSGVPEIGQLSTPPTVLPSSTVGLKVPNITPGAFEILASGWEIFTNDQDATTHKNGQTYVNNGTPMYWYQDGYWVAYYAKTYLGKTYSNSVKFSVANYHDLDKVMQDKENHMFLDHKDAHRKRNPKIYIDNRNCTSDPTKNELDLLKDFFDLTMHERQINQQEQSVPIANSGALNGHHGVNTGWIGASKNLEFFLRSDMSPKAYTTWTPIGTDDKTGNTYTQCFQGTLHGDGYTISGLDHSLFKSLCGEVYNLGVTGTFTDAGIVDTGTGYVENCWVKSDAVAVNETVKAVFGNPDDTEHPQSQQVVNCYYPETNAYCETNNVHGNARKMPVKAFYNGEVAYDLNGFYLNKRYFDHTLTETSHSNSDQSYLYFKTNNGTLETTPSTGYYSNDYKTLYAYVEDRYADGDFIYADGSVPESNNERLYESIQLGKGYYPIWPDDYLFFGQRLTYGYEDNNDRLHQDWPSHINKLNTRLTATSADINRVYRAPAYFQSKDMGVAHFNPYAVFAPYKSGDATTLAYKGMTAIDFTGYNDTFDGTNGAAKAYGQGLQGDKFFPPLLDNDGLEALRNAGITKNWLVYTPTATGVATDADSKTNTVVLDYLLDPTYTETNATYRSVAAVDIQGVHGHAVLKQGANSYVTNRNHLLVDKQDFNAPIAYTLGSGYRMWYQRVPDTFVDRTTGWEGVSIPFTAEVVTTNQKGEITHFYETSDAAQESKNNTDSKIGHEYWLREFKSGGTISTSNNDIFVANFSYPDAITGGADKSYTNTFLYDYYYHSSGGLDQNSDVYQQTYYASSHTYEDYAYAATAKPYIIGFPGTTYYEFDLSGGFKAANTKNDITKLGKQTITFASPTGITVAVSDDELAAGAVKADGYIFQPNYMSTEIAVGAFLLNNTGSSYEVTSAATAGVPFRPYFTTDPSYPVKATRTITFSQVNNSFDQDTPPMTEDELDGELQIKTKRGRIIVKSHCNSERPVRIYNTAGIMLDSYTIEPGESVETRVSTGIYIVNKTKVAVK